MLVPFVVTIVVSLLVSLYMLLDPTAWVQRLMQLTYMSTPFKVFLLALAVIGFGSSWVAEKYLLPSLAKLVGKLRSHSYTKKRKLHKCLEQEMWI